MPVYQNKWVEETGLSDVKLGFWWVIQLVATATLTAGACSGYDPYDQGERVKGAGQGSADLSDDSDGDVETAED